MCTNNASPQKAGFNYQDIVAVGMMFKYLDILERINDEGIDDIDLYINENCKEKLIYIQTKHSDNPIIGNSKPFKEGLRDLINNFKINGNKISEIFYITNVHKPMGKKFNSFNYTANNYGWIPYSFEELKQDENVVKQIKRQIEKIAYETKSNGDIKYQYVNDIYNDEKKLNNILEKLTIARFYSETKDLKNKTSMAVEMVKEFLEDKGLDSMYSRKIFDSCYLRVNETSAIKNIFLEKNDIIAEIILADINSDGVSYQQFTKNCDLSIDELDYIESNTDFIRDRFLNYIEYDGKIMKSYREFLDNNFVDGNGYETLGKFIKSKIKDLSKKLNFTTNSYSVETSALTKYIVWHIVKKHSKLEKLKG